MPERKNPKSSDFGEIVKRAAASEPVIKPDDRARNEQRRWESEAIREDRYHSAIHWVTIVGVWAVGLTIVCVLIIRIAHLVIPNQNRWLDDSQLRLIDQFLFSGTVGGVLTQGVKKLQRRPARRRRP